MNIISVKECEKDIMKYVRFSENLEATFKKYVNDLMRWQDVEFVASLENSLNAYRNLKLKEERK